MSSRPWDVIVVGLGAVGSAAASALARRGAAVLGLDRFRPPHDLGSSHGRSRIIRTAYFEDPAYVPLVRRAFQGWRELEARTGRRLLRMTGALMLGAEGSALIQGTLTSCRTWQLAHETLDAGEIARRFPALTPPPGTVGVYEADGGALAPEECIRATLGEASKAGAELRFGEPARAWEPAAGGVEVTTGTGRFRAARLVLCAGAWTPGLLRAPLPLEPERQVLHWFQPKTRPEAFTPGALPAFVWERAPGEYYYGLPEADGQAVKFARHHGGAPCDPDTVDRTVSPGDIAAVAAPRRELLPDLDEQPTASQVCLYTNSPDHHFVVGLHPAAAGVAIAAGLSGHGFKFAPALGEALADLALDGGTSLPIKRFDPGRFAGAPAS